MKSKICKKCKRGKKLSEFYKYSHWNGYYTMCKSCFIKYSNEKNTKSRKGLSVRAYYRKTNKQIIEKIRISDKEYQKNKRRKFADKKSEENKKYALSNPEKIKAYSKLHNALKTGKIIKKSCEVCGRKNTHAHHVKYSDPLKVKWLCPIHHKLEHLK